MLHARSHASLSACHVDARNIGVWQLLGNSAGHDVLRDAYAWVISAYCNPRGMPFIPALGLDCHAFLRLLRMHFPHFDPPTEWLDAQHEPIGTGGALDEFQDLLLLLIEHAISDDENHRCLAHLVATACMGSDHLWQDLGLPDRRALSQLLNTHFPSLAAKNTGDMKWKKFFYRQLCERDGLLACNRPSCAGCCDYSNCFGTEE